MPSTMKEFLNNALNEEKKGSSLEEIGTKFLIKDVKGIEKILRTMDKSIKKLPDSTVKGVLKTFMLNVEKEINILNKQLY